MARTKQVVSLMALGVALGAGSWYWVQRVKATRQESFANYVLEYPKLAGWKQEEAGFQTLFLFRHPNKSVSVRGSQSQIVHDENPTPDLDRDGLTNQFAEVTRDNLGWKATVLDVVKCKGSSYRLIRRETVDRTVVTGIAVRGNTTVLVTMTGIGKGRFDVEGLMPEFRAFLAGTSIDRRLFYDEHENPTDQPHP